MNGVLGVAKYTDKKENGEVEMLFTEDLFDNLIEKLELTIGSHIVFLEEDSNIILKKVDLVD